MDDGTLLGRFTQLVLDDRRNRASMLRHLAEIDRRKLWAKQGHSSMFGWCVVRFNWSESTAGKRIGAARTARRFPVLFDMVARGDIHLSGIDRLKAHLTPENHRDVLEQAKRKSTRQIEQLVARLAPQPDVPSRIRKLPDRAPTGGEAAAGDGAGSEPQRAADAPGAGERPPPDPPQGANDTVPPPEAGPSRPERRSRDPLPLSPGRYKLQVTLDESAHDQLRQLQDLLAHQIPDGDPAKIIQRALGALLTETKKSKAALRQRPRAPKPTSITRSRAKNPSARPGVPAHIQREVWQRDEGRCAFVGDDGRRCGETRRLEFAHLQPWAKGGDHSASNISLRCRAHNAYEAERDYGAHFIERKRQQRSSLVVREPGARYRLRAIDPSPLKLREPGARYRRRAIDPSPRMLRESVARHQPYAPEPNPRRTILSELGHRAPRSPSTARAASRGTLHASRGPLSRSPALALAPALAPRPGATVAA